MQTVRRGSEAQVAEINLFSVKCPDEEINTGGAEGDADARMSYLVFLFQHKYLAGCYKCVFLFKKKYNYQGLTAL